MSAEPSIVESGDHRKPWLVFVIASLSLIVGAVSAWLSRSDMNPDGISYLDLSDRLMAGDLSGMVNGYWGPMYPVLLAATRFVMRPSTLYEFRAVHAANFIVFCIGLLTFSLFIHELAQRSSSTASRRTSIIIWGYALFLWSSITQVTVAVVTPDLLLSALIWLIAFLVLKAADGRPVFSVALGVTCAIAFLTKSVMFPMAIPMLVAGLPRRRILRAALLSLLAFACVATPWIGALSKQKGRLTFGDTGRLAYALFIDDTAYYTHWHGAPAGSGIPVHPTRTIFEHPTAYEFNGPIQATYPPWFDPSYWNEGLRTHFNFRGHVRAAVETAKTYYVLFVKTQWAFAGLAILAVISRRRRPPAEAVRIGVPAILALGLYGVLHVEGRYVGPFMVLFFMSILISVDVDWQIWRAVSAVVVVSLAVATMVELMKQYPTRSAIPLEWPIAAALRSNGLRDGDGVASVGTVIGASWPRLARAHVVAEIPTESITEFWNATPDTQRHLFVALRRAGAKVIVGAVPDSCPAAAGWTRIPGSKVSFLFLGRM
jgi:4-amino-4-deoxy-L-arabinose transferase-like glycosyltransferase